MNLISLLKSKFISSDQIAIVKDGLNYEGLNGSILKILGQIEAKVFGEEISANAIVFRVVSDYAIKCDAILRRNTIRVLRLKLSKLEGERETETPEILNVDVSVSKRDKLDEIDVNPEMSSKTRNRFFHLFRTKAQKDRQKSRLK